MFVSMLKSSQKCICIYAADVKTRHFQDKNIDRIRDKPIQKLTENVAYLFNCLSAFLKMIFTVDDQGQTLQCFLLN